jgi:uncharacterized protein (TIGR02594 family)
VAKDPVWLRAARARLGTREAPGAANSATILGWAKRLGTRILGMIYNADSVPWCGVFVASCLAEDGIEAAPIAVRALSWTTWGLALRPERLAPGAVLVFERPVAAMSASMSARMPRLIMCSVAIRVTRSPSRALPRAAASHAAGPKAAR